MKIDPHNHQFIKVSDKYAVAIRIDAGHVRLNLKKKFNKQGKMRADYHEGTYTAHMDMFDTFENLPMFLLHPEHIAKIFEDNWIDEKVKVIEQDPGIKYVRKFTVELLEAKDQYIATIKIFNK